MSYPFKKGQVVKTAKRLDCRETSGPNIPKGTRATIVKRFRGSMLVFVDFGLKKGIGRRFEHAHNLVAV